MYEENRTDSSELGELMTFSILLFVVFCPSFSRSFRLSRFALSLYLLSVLFFPPFVFFPFFFPHFFSFLSAFSLFFLSFCCFRRIKNAFAAAVKVICNRKQKRFL